MTGRTDVTGGRKDDGSAWLVDPRVEEGFDEIGRAVADAAMREAQQRTARGETPFERGPYLL